MRLLRRLAYWVRHRSADAELAEELTMHRELVERDLVARGVPVAEARDRARRSMGNETYMREESREMWTWSWLSTVIQDLRYAGRVLYRAPGFSFVAVITLALGIGANTAMFGVVDTLLFRPPPGVRESERVVRVQVEVPPRPGQSPALSGLISYPDFVDLRDRANGFSGVAAFVRVTRAVGDGELSESESIVLASGGYFTTLGARPAVGRLLGADDDRENANNAVAVLAWDYWQRAFGGDRAVLGRSVRVGGRPFTIVGVAAKRFAGSELRSPAVWVPLSAAWELGFGRELTRMRYGAWLSAVARVREGSVVGQATAAARSALLFGRAQSGATAPGKVDETQAGPRVVLSTLTGAGEPTSEATGERTPPVSLWFLALTGIVLLIACANVANLLLARAAQRRHELAVRASIGASRGRLIRQLLTESAVLATLGGLSGLAVAIGASTLLPRVISLPPLPPILDARLVAFTLGLTIATTIIFGTIPALRVARADLLGTLNANVNAGGGRSMTRSILVIIQLAASVVLLVSAAIFLRSLRNVQAIDPGFAVDRLIVASGDTRAVRLTAEQADNFWRQSVDRVARLPGVRAAALGAALPFEETFMAPVSVPGAAGGVLPAQPDFAGATYFAALGLPIRRGRAFNDADQGTDAAPVVIINETLSRQLFGSESAVGRCIRAGQLRPGQACAEVVGVTADAKYADVTRDPGPMFYRPLGARSRGWGTVLYVRTDGDRPTLARTVARELQALDPQLQYVRVRPLTDLIEPQLSPWRTGTFIFSLFGILGLLLAAVGLYGVIALLVAQRAHEMAIRVALGARPPDVMKLIMTDGARLVAAGIVIGAGLAAAATRLFASMMYGVTSLDPLAYAATVGVLAVVAVIAVYVPTRRAMRADPMVALRAQ